jgi:hypothetical protein
MAKRAMPSPEELPTANSWPDGAVDIWGLADGKHVRRLAESRGKFDAALFTADGKLVLVTSFSRAHGWGGTIPAGENQLAQKFEGEINLFDHVTGRWLRTFLAPPPSPGVVDRYANQALLAADGRTLYVTYSTGDIIGYEIATGQPCRTFASRRWCASTLAISLAHV